MSSVAFMLAGCNLGPSDEPIRDDDGRIIESNPATDVFALAVGDCLDDAGLFDERADETSTIATVPCELEHDSEVFAALRLEGGDEAPFPGDETITQFADESCILEFERFIGLDYLQSRFDVSYLHPTPESWATGDRELLCIVYDPAGPVTGSLAGAGA